ncbi:hypothetical protein BMF94_1886 [Rhodotorula taiwanensis]|uniref:Uncharacterized protein n=1 Tax=Rhodotorula taiwanensis TaxID=741276 RepID=A0A2S5BDR6_9BASI|nr:hypothetical protein BMF94_1886 [Rhodotorula taiwanensis]
MPAVQSTLAGVMTTNAQIAAQWRSLPSLLGRFPSDPARLPTGYEALAGEEVLPPSLLLLYLKPPQNGQLHVLNRAIRSLTGVDPRSLENGNFSVWDKSEDRQALVREWRKEKLPPALSAIYSNTQAQGRASEIDLELLQVIIELFEARGLLSLAELKASIRPSQFDVTGLPRKEHLAELLLSVWTTYSSNKYRGRPTAIVAILGSATAADVPDYDFNPNVDYVADADDDNDILAPMAEAGEALGWSEEKVDDVIEKIVAGTTRKSNAKEQKADPEATKLYEHLWLVLAAQNRASDRLKEFKDHVETAFKNANGATLARQIASGHQRNLNKNETRAGWQYLLQAARDLADGKGFKNKSVKYGKTQWAAAINVVSPYVRTSKQAETWVGSHRAALAFGLVAHDLDPTLIASETFLVTAGFVKSESSLSGWTHRNTLSSDDAKFIAECNKPLVAKEQQDKTVAAPPAAASPAAAASAKSAARSAKDSSSSSEEDEKEDARKESGPATPQRKPLRQNKSEKVSFGSAALPSSSVTGVGVMSSSFSSSPVSSTRVINKRKLDETSPSDTKRIEVAFQHIYLHQVEYRIGRARSDVANDATSDVDSDSHEALTSEDGSELSMEEIETIEYLDRD